MFCYVLFCGISLYTTKPVSPVWLGRLTVFCFVSFFFCCSCFDVTGLFLIGSLTASGNKSCNFKISVLKMHCQSVGF